MKADVRTVLEAAIPELEHHRGLAQNPMYHDKTVWDHTKVVVDAAVRRGASAEVVLAARLHDVAKGWPHIRTINPKNGQPQDIGHEEAGAPVAYLVSLRLGFAQPDARHIALLVKHHGIRPTTRLGSVVKALSKIAADLSTKEELVRFVDNLFLLMESDAEGFAPRFRFQRKRELAELRPVFDRVLSLPFYPDEIGPRATHADVIRARSNWLSRNR